MAMASVKQQKEIQASPAIQVGDDVVTLNLAEMARLFTESQNPRLFPCENHDVQCIREAIEGADAVAELLLTDTLHAANAREESGYAYQQLAPAALEGLHIALRSLLRDARGRLEHLASK